MAKIKRFKNGDTCPCCGQTIRGLTDEQLDLFSVRIAAIGFEADLDPMFPEIDGDFLMVTLDDLSRALEEWRLEMEAGDDEPPAAPQLLEANVYDEVGGERGMKAPGVQVYRCPYKGTLMCPQTPTAWSDDAEVLVIGCDLGPLRNAKDDSVLCDLFVDLEVPGVHESIQKAGTFLRLVGTEAEGDA